MPTTAIVNPYRFGAGAPPPPPALLLDGLAAAPAVAYSFRKLRTAYAGSAIRIRRASDNTEQDIGFSGGDLDTAAIATFCSGTTGWVVNLYDQSANSDGGSPAGSTRMAVQATTTRQMRIFNAGAVDELTAGRPTMFAPDATARGYHGQAWGTAYTGTTLAGAVVGILSATGFSRLASIRINTGADYNSTGACTFAERRNAETNYVVSRNGYLGVTQALTNGVAYATYARFSGTTCFLRRSGAAAVSVASSGAFNVNQPLIGPEDGSVFRAQADSRWSETIIWAADPGATEADAVMADQISYWGL
jgi:Alpha-L-arabinofuranosidase B, catalytic